jgi:hypothetical protein
MSDDTFFHSFWRLMSSQTLNEKWYMDVFSSTFLKAAELASDDERREFIARISNKENLIIFSPLQQSAIRVLASFLEKRHDESGVDFITLLYSSPAETLLSLLQSPDVSFILSRGLLDESAISLFFSQFDIHVVPLNRVEETKNIFSKIPILTENISQILSNTVHEIADWWHSEFRVGYDLELSLSFLAQTPRVRLFKQIDDKRLKEKFLFTVAIGIRELAEGSSAGPELRRIFFTVPKIGDVMNRWLAIEIGKYNTNLVSAVKAWIHTSGPSGIEDLRGVIRGAFEGPESKITLPSGGRVDERIGLFLENNGEQFVYLPCAASVETIKTIISHFPSFFEIDLNGSVKLTSLGAKLTAVDPTEIKPRTTTTTAALTLGLESEIDLSGNPTQSTNNTVDDLRDILLRELLHRLPQNAFLHRPYPTKVQAGVYRFGTREVTFHVKGGELFVYRVGEFVSETDGVEFIAREFGVAADKLRKSSEDPSSMKINGDQRRRPIDWQNKILLHRLVRRGLKVGDTTWRENWIRSGGGDPKTAQLDTLVKFLERNIAHAAKQNWAKDLLYFPEGKEERPLENVLSDSDGEMKKLGFSAPAAAGEVRSNYKTRLCAMFQQGRCTRGDGCGYAHGESDLRGGQSSSSSAVASQFFKTRLCNAFLEGRCNRGAGCSYAHSETERVAPGTGVVRRDVKGTQDLRLAAKMEVMGKKREPERYGSSNKKSRIDVNEL